MRLNRYLSQCGLGSRRGCEQLILEGRVSLNGNLVKDLGTQVSSEDKVVVDGRTVRTETEVVLVLNKPRGYVCTRSDERDRMTIYDLLPKQYQTLHHVGRLDKDSEGLLLLTNRGDLSHRLIHPSMGAEKEYEVVVDQPLDQSIMAKLVKGMMTEEGHAKAERAWMITDYRAHLVLKQGLKRQIRLMMYQLGFEVERLTRTRIGWLELRGVPKGGWKELSATEVERFFSKEGTGRTSSQADKPRVAPKRARPAAKKAARTRKVREDSDFDSDTIRPTRTASAPRRAGRPQRGRDRNEESSSYSEESFGRSTEGNRRSFGRGKPSEREESGPSRRSGSSGRGFSSRSSARTSDRDEASPRSRSRSSFSSESEDFGSSRRGSTSGRGFSGRSSGRTSDRGEGSPRSRSRSSFSSDREESGSGRRSFSSGRGFSGRSGESSGHDEPSPRARSRAAFSSKGKGKRSDAPSSKPSSFGSRKGGAKRPPGGKTGRGGR